MKLFAYEVREDEKKAFFEYAEKYNVEISLSPEVPTLDNAGLADRCDGITMLGQGTIDAKLLDRYKEMGIRCISTRTIGYDHIDTEHAKHIGIPVCNAAYAPNGVAEYSVMLMLLCMRHYKAALWRMQVNDYSLGGLTGREMKDLTVGILGMGRIGRQVASILSGFGCRILGYDTYQIENPQNFTYADLDTILKECDIISLHLNLNESTHHIIGDEAISKMKQGVILINCARGGLMDTEALIRGVEKEKIGGLGLDCFEYEEGIYHQNRRDDIIRNRSMAYLRQFPNVVMTQHMAFYTDAAVTSMVRCGLEGIVSVINTGSYTTLIR